MKCLDKQLKVTFTQNTQQYDQWFHQQVQIGFESANSGNLLSARDVEEKFAIKREAARQKLGD